MAKRSAGIVLFKRSRNGFEVLLVHPGGPFWANKDAGAWSIFKGEYSAPEDPLLAAKREFLEETGSPVDGQFVPLGRARQASGKLVSAWAVEGDLDTTHFRSGLLTVEWPPRSGRMQEFPEVDRIAWFPYAEARSKILSAQLIFLERLQSYLAEQPAV